MFFFKQSLTFLVALSGLAAVSASPAAGFDHVERAAAATVQGNVLTSATNFVATFNIDDVEFIFTAVDQFGVEFVEPSSPTATLLHNTPTQLQGVQSFSGSQGHGSVSVTLSSGVTILWEIPSGIPVSNLAGEGAWSQS